MPSEPAGIDSFPTNFMSRLETSQHLSDRHVAVKDECLSNCETGETVKLTSRLHPPLRFRILLRRTLSLTW